MFGTIDKRAPHDDTPIGLDSFSQHVGSIGMGAPIIEGARLAFTVGFDKESAKVWYQIIYFFRFTLPPAAHLGIQGVGCIQLAQGLRRPEVHG